MSYGYFRLGKVSHSQFILNVRPCFSAPLLCVSGTEVEWQNITFLFHVCAAMGGSNRAIMGAKRVLFDLASQKGAAGTQRRLQPLCRGWNQSVTCFGCCVLMFCTAVSLAL